MSLHPYYQDPAVTIYHGDSAEILPQLGTYDLLLTDPPYGIKMDKGSGGGGHFSAKFGGKKRDGTYRSYEGGWDNSPPDPALMRMCLDVCKLHIIWGGNYLSGMLPQMPKWLIWDKETTMPTYSDAELAWTTLSGVSVKMIRHNGNGMMAKERVRFHPTQKPLAVITWCISLAGDVQTILDPFAGSGTTGRAAKDLGKQAVLIEQDERNCEISAMRMQQEVFAL